MAAIESLELKTETDFEAFGNMAFLQLQRFKDSKNYGDLLKSFMSNLLSFCSPQQIKAFEQLVQDQCNSRIKESKEKDKPVIKYKERKTDIADDSDDDQAVAVGGFVMEDDETLRKKELVEKVQEEVERRGTIVEAEKAERRLFEMEKNQTLLKFKERRLDAKDAQAATADLAAKGFVMLEPPPWEKKGGKGKGKK